MTTTIQDFGFLPRIVNASIAGIVGVTCVFPIDLAKTRWQNTPVPLNGAPRQYNSFVDCFVKTFKAEGIRGMYKGSSVNLILITPEKAIKLVANDGFRYLLKKEDGSLTIPRGILAGASAGMCQIVITTPMELLKISLQDSGRTAVAGVKQLSATELVSKIFKEKGFKGFFHGGASTLARDVTFSACYFPMFATLNKMGEDPVTKSVPFYHTFTCGLVSGCLSAFIVTPLDVIKTRIQTTTKAPGEIQYTKIGESFKIILKNEGPSALFKGAVARCCVVAPLFGIAQTFYYLGVAETLLGVKKMRQI